MQGFYTGSKSNPSLVHGFKKHVSSSLIKARVRVSSNFGTVWDNFSNNQREANLSSVIILSY